MALRTSPPALSAQATDLKLIRKLEEKRNTQIFYHILMGILVFHLLFSVLVIRSGIVGYFKGWQSMFTLFLEQPYLAIVPMMGLIALHRGIAMYRSPDLGPIVLPAFPSIPDLRFDNRIYIGSSWTRDGKQPGEVLEPNDEVFDEEECHVIMEEAGLFGNIHVKGGIGSGKTSTLIMPALDQAVGKWPLPPRPEKFTLGSDGKYKGSVSAQKAHHSVRDRVYALTHHGALPPTEASMGDPIPLLEAWEPYVGMTPAEAESEYTRLMEQHQERKWGIFLLDPKGDMTDQVQRLCAMAGREEDFIALRPDGEFTYNPLTVSASPLVQAEMVMDGIEAVSGQAVQQYWRSTMSEWMTNALEILRVVEPTRITFKNLLRMARSEALCQRLVAAADALMRSSLEEEERLRRLGQPYHGVRVNPAAIEFFRDWLDEDADPSRKQGVVSGVKSQAKFFVDDKTAPFLCPELPPTFTGFEDMIHNGRVVVLSMPLDEFGPVAKVLGILVLCDAQQAARARINKPAMNQERVVLFAIDEIANYLNPATRDFVSMNRQSRVCVLAAHQSQAQLIRQDKSFENSFNDNLRTKISYCAPNAISGRSESGLFGGRKVYKERLSQNTVFNRVEREWGKEAVNPIGGESQSFSLSVEEVERPWFEPEDFMSLKTGEMVILPFNGESQELPRKIRCPAFFRSERANLMKSVEIESQKRAPHPVVYVSSKEEDQKYLSAGLQQAGFVISEPLADKEGDMVGMKFITDVGTLIVELEAFESSEAQSLLEERMTHPQTLILFADFPICSHFFAGTLGLSLERVASFAELYKRAFPDMQGRNLYQIIEEQTGKSRCYNPLNSWEYHTGGLRNKRMISRDSRAVLHTYSTIGQVLAELPDEEMEILYEKTRERIAAILRGEDPNPPSGGPAGGPGGSPSPDDLDGGEADDNEDISTETLDVDPEDIAAPFASDTDDPFAGEAYPEALAALVGEADSESDSLEFIEDEAPDFSAEVLEFDVPDMGEDIDVGSIFDAEPEIPEDEYLFEDTPDFDEPAVSEEEVDDEPSVPEEPVRESASLKEEAQRKVQDALRLMDEIDVGPLDQAEPIGFLFNEPKDGADTDEETVEEDASTADTPVADTEEPASADSSSPRRSNARSGRRSPRKPTNRDALSFGFSSDAEEDSRDGKGGAGEDDGDADDVFGAPL